MLRLMDLAHHNRASRHEDLAQVNPWRKVMLQRAINLWVFTEMSDDDGNLLPLRQWFCKFFQSVSASTSDRYARRETA